jgi:hypothetical protein
MYGKVKHAAYRRTVYVLFVLIICACSLAVHFVAEGLEPGLFVNEATRDTIHIHLFHDHVEDLFTFSFPDVSLPVALMLISLQLIISHSHSVQISPQLPPPNS